MKHLCSFTASNEDAHVAVSSLTRSINEYFGESMNVVKDVSHSVVYAQGEYTASAIVLIEEG